MEIALFNIFSWITLLAVLVASTLYIYRVVRKRTEKTDKSVESEQTVEAIETCESDEEVSEELQQELDRTIEDLLNSPEAILEHLEGLKTKLTPEAFRDDMNVTLSMLHNYINDHHYHLDIKGNGSTYIRKVDNLGKLVSKFNERFGSVTNVQDHLGDFLNVVVADAYFFTTEAFLDPNHQYTGGVYYGCSEDMVVIFFARPKQYGCDMVGMGFAANGNSTFDASYFNPSANVDVKGVPVYVNTVMGKGVSTPVMEFGMYKLISRDNEDGFEMVFRQDVMDRLHHHPGYGVFIGPAKHVLGDQFENFKTFLNLTNVSPDYPAMIHLSTLPIPQSEGVYVEFLINCAGRTYKARYEMHRKYEMCQKVPTEKTSVTQLVSDYLSKQRQYSGMAVH